jgi:hypothetical protein
MSFDNILRGTVGTLGTLLFFYLFEPKMQFYVVFCLNPCVSQKKAVILHAKLFFRH